MEQIRWKTSPVDARNLLVCIPVPGSWAAPPSTGWRGVPVVQEGAPNQHATNATRVQLAIPLLP